MAGGEVVIKNNMKTKKKLIKYNNIKPFSYLIYSDGKVYSLLSHRFLTFYPDKDGYLTISLRTTNNKTCKYRLAMLVISHFKGRPPEGMVDATVDHIDGNKQNNYYKNLRWLERGENSRCRMNKGIGSQNPAAILNEAQVVEICHLLTDTSLTLKQIANIYHVHQSTINNIKRKQKWKNITNNYNFNRPLTS